MTTISFEATFGAGPNIEREVQRRLRIPKIPELHLPEVSDDELSDIVPRYNDLIPLGDTGLHITPNDPVDPWDCDAWPDSPYCDGGGLVVDPIGGRGVGGVADVAGDECEICVTVTPSILWMRGPVYTVCYRKPECRPEGDTPEVDNSDIEDGIPQDAPQAPVAPDGYCRVLWAWHERGILRRITALPSVNFLALGAVQGIRKLGPIPLPVPTAIWGSAGELRFTVSF
jgi:hypothetical protein